MSEDYIIHEHDVVIIGAGGAGLRAAIEASNSGVSVAMICKSMLGKAHTVMAEGGAAAASAAASAADQAQREQTTRRADEFRTVRMQTGVVKHASGSAHVEIGRTKVVCSVFGPRAVTGRAAYSDMGTINCDVKFAPFACAGGRRERGQGHDDARTRSPAVRRRRAPETRSVGRGGRGASPRRAPTRRPRARAPSSRAAPRAP